MTAFPAPLRDPRENGAVLLVAGSEIEARRIFRENPGRFTDYVTPRSGEQRLRGIRAREVYIAAGLWSAPASDLDRLWPYLQYVITANTPRVWEERAA